MSWGNSRGSNAFLLIPISPCRIQSLRGERDFTILEHSWDYFRFPLLSFFCLSSLYTKWEFIHWMSRKKVKIFQDVRLVHTSIFGMYCIDMRMPANVSRHQFQVSMQTDIPTCIVFFSLLHYFHLTNFFWMFVEGAPLNWQSNIVSEKIKFIKLNRLFCVSGLYLYLLVVKTFTRDNIKLRLCLAIGWGKKTIPTAPQYFIARNVCFYQVYHCSS